MRRWVIRAFTHVLTKPLKSYELRVPNNLDALKGTLRKGDVILIEGDQRVSQVIRYLTQSSWSHTMLYIGDHLLKGDSLRAADLRRKFGSDAAHLIVEAEVGEGVVVNSLKKYERFNLRICRPKHLRREDVDPVLDHIVQHLGDSYDVRHICDLARYFFPVSLVPRRWRRAALRLGSGSDRAVICSCLVGRAFRTVGYPILPQVRLDGDTPQRRWWHRVLASKSSRPPARFREQELTLITPRDFDLSPYFEIVKINHLADPNFRYRDIVWDTDSNAA